MVTLYERFLLKIPFFLFLMLCAAVEDSSAQRSVDTVSLIEVDIITDRERVSRIGKRTERIDSVFLRQFLSQSISEALSAGSGIFVRSYGPGAAAAPAFRGGSSAQSAVVWEGFNLQNTMLGYTDLSLLPAVLFNQMRIEYGASAASWGSGAMSGAIHLGDRKDHEKGISVLLNGGGGSFGRRFFSGRADINTGRLQTHTRFYLTGSQNNFVFHDSLDLSEPYKKQENSAYSSRGIMQTVRYRLNNLHRFGVNIWGSENYRQIPAYGSSVASKALEKNKALRLSADHGYSKGNFRSATRAAVFDETINYNDSLLKILTNNRLLTLTVENENNITWNRKNESNFSLVFNKSRGITEFYGRSRELLRTGVVAGHQLQLFSRRLMLAGHIRGEYFSGGKLPVTWNAGATLLLGRNITLSANGGKVYRQPTLNELYWVPGGNQLLEPEEGYSAESSLSYKRVSGKWDLDISGSAFSRIIDNWILWLPGAAGSPEARNIQKVWSRGSDTKSVVRFKDRGLMISFTLLSSYVLSTVSEIDLANDETSGRQLPFTPRYIVNAHLHVQYHNVGLFFYSQYTGYRFITSDNRQWMPPYSISGARITYSVLKRPLSIELFGSVNNMFDRSYSVMPGRPMPGRNYEAGITIQYHKQLNKNK